MFRNLIRRFHGHGERQNRLAAGTRGYKRRTGRRNDRESQQLHFLVARQDGAHDTVPTTSTLKYLDMGGILSSQIVALYVLYGRLSNRV